MFIFTYTHHIGKLQCCPKFIVGYFKNDHSYSDKMFIPISKLNIYIYIYSYLKIIHTYKYTHTIKLKNAAKTLELRIFIHKSGVGAVPRKT